MVGRAATNITGTKQTYFFKGNQYVKINFGTPGQTDDTIAYGPTEFVKEWASLKETGFSRIDAILPIPGHDHRAYFFSGSKYARIEYVPSAGGDKVLGGVRSIAENWASIKKAGFDHVDAALPVPGTTDQAYIFSDDQYARIRWTELKNDDELLDGPKPITTGWGKTGLNSFDTIIQVPGSDKDTYVFSYNQYSRINLVVGGNDELITGPKDVAPYWPSLKKAGFY